MIEIDVNDEDVVRTLRRLPAKARRDLIEALGDYAQAITRRSRSRAQTRLQRLAIRSLTEQQSPQGASITAGGNARLPNGNGTYGDVFFGAEFGGGSRPRTRQFAPYRSKGYAFWPAVWARQDVDRLIEVLTKIERDWGR